MWYNHADSIHAFSEMLKESSTYFIGLLVDSFAFPPFIIWIYMCYLITAASALKITMVLPSLMHSSLKRKAFTIAV